MWVSPCKVKICICPNAFAWEAERSDYAPHLFRNKKKIRRDPCKTMLGSFPRSDCQFLKIVRSEGRAQVDWHLVTVKLPKALKIR